MSPPERVKLAVLGCGWIAGNRLRQIGPLGLAEIVALADPDSRAIDAVRRWAPRARCAHGVEDLVRRDVQAVMVSTPSALHSAQAVALLEQGLPVFVQKPLGVSGREVRKVLEAAGRAGVPLGTDLCYRHLRSARAARAALTEDSIGEVFLVEAAFHNAYRPGAGWSHEPALAGGGALMDLGIHLLDLVMWLTGSPLLLNRTTLRRRGRPWKEDGIEDFAALDLECAGGMPVRIVTSWDASTGRDAEIGLRIYGERGNIEISNRDGSFFDFDARLCRGTRVEPLASDDGDAWQAGPLAEWLGEVARRQGFERPLWVEEPMKIIDQAYALGRQQGGVESTAAGGTVHVLGRKGVVP